LIPVRILFRFLAIVLFIGDPIKMFNLYQVS